MDYLITYDSKLPAEDLAAILRAQGIELKTRSAPVPLDGGEMSLEIEATDAQADALRSDPQITGVYPSSDLTLYGN